MKIKVYWLVLIVIIAVITLAGCKNDVTDEQLKEMDEIAQCINDKTDYEIPDGYKIYHPYFSGSVRFYLIKDHTYAIYDITLNGISRVDVKPYIPTRIILALGILCMIVIVISYVFTAVKTKFKN